MEGTQCRLFAGMYGIADGKGRGIIALEPIKKGQLIFEYAGMQDLKTSVVIFCWVLLLLFGECATQLHDYLNEVMLMINSTQHHSFLI